jgi:hypothetical protein
MRSAWAEPWAQLGASLSSWDGASWGLGPPRGGRPVEPIPSDPLGQTQGLPPAAPQVLDGEPQGDAPPQTIWQKEPLVC